MWRRGRPAATAWLQVDDPYSVLLAQRLPELAAVVDLRLVIVPAPEEAFTPDAERLRAWALRDAKLLALQHGLRFSPDAALPSPDAVDRANAAVLAEPTPERTTEIGLALFEGRELPPGEPDRQLLQDRGRSLREAGHYRSGMVQLEGEWDWGIDRLPFVEERLRAEGLELPTRTSSVVAPHPGPADELEFFFSFRSPYSYLAIDRVAAIAERHGVPLRIRPVLPMVMRGLSVPKVKVLDIARDCARLARHHGVPFGLISDPLGTGIARCLALFGVADEAGKGLAWIRSAGRGIWSEGLDVESDRDLRVMAERAGLDWESSRAAFAGDAHMQLAEENRQALLDLGLWGVPSFRYGSFSAWGQDRLPLLDAVIARGAAG